MVYKQRQTCSLSLTTEVSSTLQKEHRHRKTCSVSRIVIHREQSSPVASVCQKQTSSSEPLYSHVSFSFSFTCRCLWHVPNWEAPAYFNGATKSVAEKVVSECVVQTSRAVEPWSAPTFAFFSFQFPSKVFISSCAIPRSFNGALAASFWKVPTISHPMDDVLKRHKEEEVKKSSSKKEQTTRRLNKQSPFAEVCAHRQWITSADDHAITILTTSTANHFSLLSSNSLMLKLFRFNLENKFSLSPPHLIVKYLTSATFFTLIAPFQFATCCCCQPVHPNCQFAFVNFFFFTLSKLVFLSKLSHYNSSTSSPSHIQWSVLPIFVPKKRRKSLIFFFSEKTIIQQMREYYFVS